MDADTWKTLIDAMQKSGKQYDIEKITEAKEFATAAHEGQQRKSGDPYIIHPISVANILIDMGMDTDTIIAALLHDVAEDTEVTIAQIEKKFGKEVSLLVDGVTKLGKLTFSSKEEQQAENVRKMLLAVAQDVRVIIIKLADRLHNMRTIVHLSEQKRRDKARETMEVYAPLAHRLGIHQIKEELEDLSLKNLDPVSYDEIERRLDLGKNERQIFLENIEKKIMSRLKGEYETITIEGRVKSIYGLYRKVFMQGRSFEEIYDIYAVRIIVDSVYDCYYVLGVIHDLFRPIPNRFKDYISTPKQNMYQSLHTTVIDKEGIPFEVQIRTWEMHYTAEYGIAAHWKYKAGVSSRGKLDERLAWVRQLLEAQKESDNVEDLVRSIKTDLSSDEVFVFTPKGEVKSLPLGSNIIDFAYAIHSAVGNRMIGAKMDGRIVSIETPLKTGSIVEILTTNQKDHGPSRDWINIVRTTEARNKIRSWFKKERREENIQQGKAEIEREFKRNHMILPEPQMSEFLLEIAKKQHLSSIDDLCAAIGYGGISLTRIMPRLKEDFLKTYRTTDEARLEKLLSQKPKKERKAHSGVIVEGLDSVLVKFARCCNPLPGDEIIGFITRGFGVSVHKKDCTNVISSMQNPEHEGRWVNAYWADVLREKFQSTIDIYSSNREGILADLSITLTNLHIQIHSLTARELKDGHSSIQITVAVSDIDQLIFLISNLKKIPGIISVERTVQ